MKFKVGDIVTGTFDNPYNITKMGVECEVVNIFDDNWHDIDEFENLFEDEIDEYGKSIKLKVLDRNGFEGYEYWVKPEYFDLVKTKKNNYSDWR